MTASLHPFPRCTIPRCAKFPHVDVTHLGSPLGTKSLGENGVGEAGNVGVTLLDNGDGENGDVGADDAAADGLSDSLSSSSGAVARVALGQKEADSVCLQDTLLHGETAGREQPGGVSSVRWIKQYSSCSICYVTSTHPCLSLPPVILTT